MPKPCVVDCDNLRTIRLWLILHGISPGILPILSEGQLGPTQGKGRAQTRYASSNDPARQALLFFEDFHPPERILSIRIRTRQHIRHRFAVFRKGAAANRDDP